MRIGLERDIQEGFVYDMGPNSRFHHAVLFRMNYTSWILEKLLDHSVTEEQAQKEAEVANNHFFREVKLEDRGEQFKAVFLNEGDKYVGSPKNGANPYDAPDGYLRMGEYTHGLDDGTH